MKLKALTLFCLSLASRLLLAQCNPDEFKIRIEIDPDEYFQEVYVGVIDPNLQAPLEFQPLDSAEPQSFEFCIAPNFQCYKAFVYDEGGDGFPGGQFKIYVNDVLVLENLTGEFELIALAEFNCPPGASCEQALETDLGLDTIPEGKETWFKFVPQNTGTYKFNACGYDNFCKTKFWLYDFCSGLVVTDNQAGALFYADANCSDGAVATMYLAGGKTYYLRVKHKYPSCVGNRLIYNLSYEGPVKGCTDPNACNYQPLATVSDTCYYDSLSCLRLPDLETDEGMLRSSMVLVSETNNDACTVEEGCIRGFGQRQLLRFSTRISNIGDEDYFIGETPSSPATPSDQFIWDPCHNHWHYRGYAEYLLYKPDGTRVPIGSKNGFCVLDLECNTGFLGKYTCENMGISAGCGDVYDAQLPCQWVDITDLEAGSYTFVMRVNWDQSPDKNGRKEKNYKNNWAQACFNLTYDADGNPEVELVDECPQFTDCTGELFGSAQPDCEGNCKGPVLTGDWNKDTLRNATDLEAYLQTALAGDGTATACNDLYDDGVINVYDAALLQECTLHALDLQYWGSRYPCNFPAGLVNTGDQVIMQLGALDKTAQTLKMRIFNPNQRLYGFQFNMSGISIDSITFLEPEIKAEVRFDNTTGDVVILSRTEQGLKKHSASKDFMRIHYSALTAEQVCLKEITAIVNEKYQLSNASIGSLACVATGISAVHQVSLNAYGLSVQPNPFDQSATVYFDNAENAAVDLELSDMNGRILRRFDNIRSDRFGIERGNLPAGMYLLTLRGPKGADVVKLMVGE